MPPLLTPDQRYLVVRGRLWRASNPALAETDRARLTRELMAARRAVDAETNRTNLFSIDRELRGPPVTRQVVDGLIVCTPSWQRLRP